MQPGIFQANCSQPSHGISFPRRTHSLFIAHFRQPIRHPHGESSEDIWSTFHDPAWKRKLKYMRTKSPSPEHEASDRVSWLGFLWPPKDPLNKHHDGGPTSNPTTSHSYILAKSIRT
jgi:hypothetical protein